MNEIINGDCLEELKEMEDNSIDLTVTSPPYDNLRTYNGNNNQWGEHVWKGVIKELYKVTKEGGVVVWVVGDQTIKGSESATSFKQALHFIDCGLNLHDTMIYQKDNPPPVGGSNRYYQHFEYMFVFSKGKPKTFNPILRKRRNKYNDKRTERTKGFNRDADGNFTKKKVSLIGDVKIGNIWKYVVGGGNSVECGIKHPATFPEKLAQDHIISWSNEGDTVLDPFMGSGTTGKMAKKLGRNFIGIELDAEYCKIAKARIDAAYE
jgi:site-specific DNA-methyltransferase (adenine-specific)